MLTYKDIRTDEDFLSFIEDYKKASDRRARNNIIIDMAYYYSTRASVIRMWLVRHGEYIIEKC